MTRPARAILIAALLAALGVLAFKLFERPIAAALFERAANANVGADRSADLPDGLHVYVCGSGSPMADPKSAGPCLGVLAGEHVLIFDVGSGSMRVLNRMGFPVGRTDRLFLTHLHSDHLDGMGELMVQSWVPEARAVPLPVSGPPGTGEVAEGFNLAYRIDSTYRTAHHGPAVANPAGYGLAAEEIELPEGTRSKVVLKDGDLVVTAIRVSHDPVEDAYGYRIDYKGRSIAISGDTAYDTAFAEAARGVDVMFHEALDTGLIKTMEEAARRNGAQASAKVLSDIPDYHTAPVDAARIAHQAEAKALVLYHITPPMPLALFQSLFLEGTADEFTGEIRLAADGDKISLPAASKSIEFEKVL